MSAKIQNIAIVGAGPVGTLMAIYLTRRGYRVHVFERRQDLRTGKVDAGRSINLALSNRGIRALKEVGLASGIDAISLPMHGRVVHDVKGMVTTVPYGEKGQFISSVERTALNALLINEADRLGIKFNFEHRVVDVNILSTSVRVQSPTSTTSQEFDLIIGSDGAFSAVRGSLQITDRFNFSQQYIEHGYKEFFIPPDKATEFKLKNDGLHIWPRESFMMIALPNADGSFTATLFYPYTGTPSFASLDTEGIARTFFEMTFPDFVRLAPDYYDDFKTNPTSSLVTVQCWPWAKNKTLLVGDAAHAIVPFYGQGMNAGLEDCRLLNDLLDETGDDWDETMAQFETIRKPDADAIAQMALDNFIEMRDLVADENFKLRKKIEAAIHTKYPDRWIPLYSMVTFHDDIRYSTAYEIGMRQKAIMDEVMQTPDISIKWQELDLKKIAERL